MGLLRDGMRTEGGWRGCAVEREGLAGSGGLD